MRTAVAFPSRPGLNVVLSQVLRMDQQDTSKKFSKGEEVLAVYPDTTAFYQATIVQVRPCDPLLRVRVCVLTAVCWVGVVMQGTRKANAGIDQTVTVQFFGDADEFGETPSRVVPVRYLIRL